MKKFFKWVVIVVIVLVSVLSYGIYLNTEKINAKYSENISMLKDMQFTKDSSLQVYSLNLIDSLNNELINYITDDNISKNNKKIYIDYHKELISIRERIQINFNISKTNRTLDSLRIILND